MSEMTATLDDGWFTMRLSATIMEPGAALTANAKLTAGCGMCLARTERSARLQSYSTAAMEPRSGKPNGSATRCRASNSSQPDQPPPPPNLKSSPR